MGVLGDIHSSTTEKPEKHQTLFLWPYFGIREVVNNSLWNFGKIIYQEGQIWFRVLEDSQI